MARLADEQEKVITMADVYKKLAQRLDEFPNGFPATESGVELKILKKIFSPAEAEFHLKLENGLHTAEEVAEKLDLPVEETRTTLDSMAEKGQIGSFKTGGRQKYMAVPFVIGIYEFQLKHIDKEMAELFEEYFPHLFQKVGDIKPQLARVVPVNKTVAADHQILTHEDLRQMIENAKSFTLRDCICRKEQELLNNPCSHSKETCLGLSPEENAFDYFNYAGEIISKEKALEVLQLASDEGLVSCTYNVQKGHSFICNCCPCCCGLLKGMLEYDAPHVIAASNFLAHVDEDLCISCGVCLEERCPAGAFEKKEDSYRVIEERCIGCGVCVVTCPTEAISMLRKDEDKQDKPPANLVKWTIKRAISRKRAKK